MKTISAKELGIVSCEVCGCLVKISNSNKQNFCPLCGNILSFRRVNSLQRTWALIIVAIIFYIPANLLPIMTTITPTRIEENTIMDGIVFFYQSGSWPLALIILVASIIIPFVKIISLSYLLITVHFHYMRYCYGRTHLYRLIGFLGRWSMIDVFVVSFVVALVQLNPIMSVKPNMGIFFFSAVVILTMFAVETFDPRLIWDSRDGYNERIY
jgi:paraquat-inducible protein A